VFCSVLLLAFIWFFTLFIKLCILALVVHCSAPVLWMMGAVGSVAIGYNIKRCCIRAICYYISSIPYLLLHCANDVCGCGSNQSARKKR